MTSPFSVLADVQILGTTVTQLGSQISSGHANNASEILKYVEEQDEISAEEANARRAEATQSLGMAQSIVSDTVQFTNGMLSNLNQVVGGTINKLL